MTTEGNKQDKPAKAKATPNASDETPSGIAAKEAGKLADDATDEEKVAWNEAYTAAHIKAQRG